MKQRSRAQAICVALCLLSALLCALNRAPVLALAHGIAGVFVWRVRFGQPLGEFEVDVLMAKLRDARQTEEASVLMIRGTVMASVIATPSSATRWPQAAIAFRDELSTQRWRQVTTALRHQSPAALPSPKNRKFSSN